MTLGGVRVIWGGVRDVKLPVLHHRLVSMLTYCSRKKFLSNSALDALSSI